jgi:hypothetical protein
MAERSFGRYERLPLESVQGAIQVRCAGVEASRDKAAVAGLVFPTQKIVPCGWAHGSGATVHGCTVRLNLVVHVLVDCFDSLAGRIHGTEETQGSGQNYMRGRRKRGHN